MIATDPQHALEWRDACAQHEAALRRSPEADAAWREVQRWSDAAQMAARRMRGAL